MIDSRLVTFLKLSETGSYTKTALELNMTQPSVSQHIHYLEEYYQVNLILSKGKNFALTQEGVRLRDYARMLYANTQKIAPLLLAIQNQESPLRFGATLTIGEYTMPPIISQFIEEMPSLSVSMMVDNTQELQRMLWDGVIDFALLEGHFSHDQFEHRLLSTERFIGVCASSNSLATRKITLADLLTQRLIHREQGSGTRDILEHSLYQHNYSLNDFNLTLEIGNMAAIKSLCGEDKGITFVYEQAVINELRQGVLSEMHIDNFNVTHPFTFVYLKNSLNEAKILEWYDKISKHLKKR